MLILQMVSRSKNEVQEDRGVPDLRKAQERLPDLHAGFRVRSPCTGRVTILSCWIQSTVSLYRQSYYTILMDLEYGLPVQVELLYYHVGSGVRSPCTGTVTILPCWIQSTVSLYRQRYHTILLDQEYGLCGGTLTRLSSWIQGTVSLCRYTDHHFG